MTSGKSDKIDSEQIFSLLNEAQKLVLRIRTSSANNNSIDITALNHNDEVDQPDPLRIPEVIIVISVLLLWCGSIFIFIRHSDILRIRHRDLPYRTSVKPPMNLNHITVVHRTSDMVIHSKPRLSTGPGLASGYNRKLNEYKTTEPLPSSSPYLYQTRRHTHSFDSTNSIPKYPEHNGQLLDPYMISYDVRRSLLDLHRKSMENLSAIRYSMSFSTNDVSTRQQNDDKNLTVEERCIQESPV